jgi:hypothetical protein
MVKPVEKTSGHRSEGNIKMDLKERGREDADWIHLAQIENTNRL